MELYQGNGAEKRVKHNDYYVENGTAYVKLRKSTEIMICNQSDWEFYKQFTWYLGINGYATARANSKLHYFHLDLMKKIYGYEIDMKYRIVDHRDGNKLNNKRENMQVTTQQVNVIKSKIRKTNKSGHKGVFYRKDTNKWTAFIHVNQRNIYLGCYVDKSDAVNARKKAEDKYYRPILESM